MKSLAICTVALFVMSMTTAIAMEKRNAAHADSYSKRDYNRTSPGIPEASKPVRSQGRTGKSARK